MTNRAETPIKAADHPYSPAPPRRHCKAQTDDDKFYNSYLSYSTISRCIWSCGLHFSVLVLLSQIVSLQQRIDLGWAIDL